MEDIIKSSQNKSIKLIKSLQQKKYRDEYSLFVIEGEKLVREALCYKADIAAVFIAGKLYHKEEWKDILEGCIKKSIEVLVVDDRLFDDITETETPQGIAAIIRKDSHALETVLSKDEVNIIILDEIRDPGNLGTIIRTADACAMNAVILTKGCVDLYNGKSIRSTMGSIFHLPIITDVDFSKLFELLEASRVSTVSADPYGALEVQELPKLSKKAIIIGNESRGVKQYIKENVEYNVKIPMPGKAESLNAGIAAAIMMYEICVRSSLSK